MELVEAIKERESRDRRELFSEGLVDTLVKQKQVKIHDDNLKRMLASYKAS